MSSLHKLKCNLRLFSGSTVKTVFKQFLLMFSFFSSVKLVGLFFSMSSLLPRKRRKLCSVVFFNCWDNSKSAVALTVTAGCCAGCGMLWGGCLKKYIRQLPQKIVAYYSMIVSILIVLKIVKSVWYHVLHNMINKVFWIELNPSRLFGSFTKFQ